MSSAVTPIDDLARRIPIVAKLRAGHYKNGRPQALDKWRATSSSRPWAQSFADRYGGEVKPFSHGNSPHEWEVYSETDEVRIALIGEQGYSISYELWTKGGCQRRCDGVTAEVLETTGPDSVEYTPHPCICDRKGVLECSLKSRLTVVLPDLPFAGGVVYETSSQNFAEESQGMLTLLQQMQSQGVHRGVLRLEERRSSGNRRYTIATVGIEESLDALASGTPTRGLAPVPERPALEDGEDEVSPRTGGGGDAEHQVGSAPEGAVNGDAASEGAGKVPSDTEDIVEAQVVEEPMDDAEESRLRATFMGIVHGDVCGLEYGSQVRPFLRAKYGASWSGLEPKDKRALVKFVTRGERRAQKEAAQREFREKVRDFLDEEGGS